MFRLYYLIEFLYYDLNVQTVKIYPMKYTKYQRSEFHRDHQNHRNDLNDPNDPNELNAYETRQNTA